MVQARPNNSFEAENQDISTLGSLSKRTQGDLTSLEFELMRAPETPSKTYRCFVDEYRLVNIDLIKGTIKMRVPTIDKNGIQRGTAEYVFQFDYKNTDSTGLNYVFKHPKYVPEYYDYSVDVVLPKQFVDNWLVSNKR